MALKHHEPCLRTQRERAFSNSRAWATSFLLGLLACNACGSDAEHATGTGGGGGQIGVGAGGSAGHLEAGAGGEAQSAAGGPAAGASGGDTEGGSGGEASISPKLDRRLAIGSEYGCAVKSDKKVVCWGTPALDLGQAAPPGASFLGIAGKYASNCGITSASGISCWGNQDNGTQVPPAGQFLRMDVGVSLSCAVSTAGRVVCWGDTLPPFDAASTYTQVGAGRKYACALKSDRSIQCVGSIAGTAAVAPTGSFVMLAAGNSHACALKTDGTLACWGFGGPGDPTDGSDSDHASWGQAIPPSGQFIDIAVGISHSCALRMDGTAVCWGAGKTNGACDTSLDGCGMAAPPSDTFSELGLGYTHSCGLRRDNTLVCWGSNTGNRSTPPTGPI